MIPSLLVWLGAVLAAPLLPDLRSRMRAQQHARHGPPWGTTWAMILRHLRLTTPRDAASTPVSTRASHLAWVCLVLALALLPGTGVVGLGFEGDLILFIYLLLLSRLAELVAVVDGADWTTRLAAEREARVLLGTETTLALLLGGLAAISQSTQLDGIFSTSPRGPHLLPLALVLLSMLGLVVASSGASPSDEPSPVSELLGNRRPLLASRSGPELATLLWASSLRLLISAGLFGATLRLLIPGRLVIIQLIGVLLAVVVLGVLDSRAPRQTPPRALGLVLSSALLGLVAASILLLRHPGAS